MIKCVAECGKEFPAHALQCQYCYRPKFANVNLAGLPEAQTALDKRYQDALQESKKSGTFDKVKAFEAHVQSNGKAVINLDVKILEEIIRGKNYVNYHKVKSMYPSKDFEEEGRRIMIDSRFFGNFAEKIVFAALSTDGQGIHAYGNCTITIEEAAITHRTSLLEEDSFRFFEKLEQKGKKIEYQGAQGFIATWDEKHKLAVAKLANKIDNKDTLTTFSEKLVAEKSSKDLAQFIELHIFGDFPKEAIEDLTYFDETDLPKDKRLRQKAKIDFVTVKEYFNKI